MMRSIAVTGSFDDLRSPQVRFLEGASRLGDLTVWLWPDDVIQALQGKAPKFPLEERRYVLEAIRYVSGVRVVDAPFTPDRLPISGEVKIDTWVVLEGEDTPQKRAWCTAHGLQVQVLAPSDLQGFPEMHFDAPQAPSGKKKVVVTGCFDWLHSGHVRFFEEVSSLGDLYVVVGHDENVRLLKGAGHPLFPQDERRYMVQSVRTVRQALISSGKGWMDAEPEIAMLKPDIYAVNEDGDRPEKRAFCAERGLEYVVLKRIPKEGLPRRQSTDLRGF